MEARPDQGISKPIPIPNQSISFETEHSIEKRILASDRQRGQKITSKITYNIYILSFKWSLDFIVQFVSQSLLFECPTILASLCLLWSDPSGGICPSRLSPLKFYRFIRPICSCKIDKQQKLKLLSTKLKTRRPQ